MSEQDQRTKMFGNAESYERFMGRWSRVVAPLFVQFAGVPDGSHILDIGSGTGSLAFAAAELMPSGRILGIDPSGEYIGYANSRNAFANRVAFRVGDAQRLELPEGSFGAALSLLVFNFIPDPAKALSEARRVTIRGGVIAAAVWDYGDAMRMLRAFWDAAVSLDPGVEKRDEKWMPLCRRGELERLWTRGGLEKVREQSLDVEMHFRSFSDYWDPFLLGQGPAGAYAASLDHHRLAALRTEVKRRLSVTAEETPILLAARVWAVRGIAPKKRPAARTTARRPQ